MYKHKLIDYIKGSINNAFFILQLEKAREATDAANLRAAYAEVVIDNLTNGASSTKDVVLTQQEDGWQDSSITNIGGVSTSNITVGKNKTVTVGYDADNKTATFTTK